MTVLRIFNRYFLFAGMVAGLASCVGSATIPPKLAVLKAPSRVSRAEVMATAMGYASHPWRGTVANAKHSSDPSGIRVDTPDISYQEVDAVPGYWVPGQLNYGLPYQWGGFSTPEQFDAGLAEGKAAGDVYTKEKRALLDHGVSAAAVGIDCSGFVSRCWDLPRSFSTRELAALCEALPTWTALKPGDALNVYNAHVLLFSGWVDKDQKFLAAYETGGPPDWKVTRHVIGVDFLKEKGYRPLRYRGIKGV